MGLLATHRHRALVLVTDMRQRTRAHFLEAPASRAPSSTHSVATTKATLARRLPRRRGPRATENGRGQRQRVDVTSSLRGVVEPEVAVGDIGW